MIKFPTERSFELKLNEEGGKVIFTFPLYNPIDKDSFVYKYFHSGDEDNTVYEDLLKHVAHAIVEVQGVEDLTLPITDEVKEIIYFNILTRDQRTEANNFYLGATPKN